MFSFLFFLGCFNVSLVSITKNLYVQIYKFRTESVNFDFFEYCQRQSVENLSIIML
jgi:hypothetical protein